MTEPIKLLELFSGIQAQERSLRQIGIPYESVGVCDCDKDVLVSAAAMRFNLEEEIANYDFPSAEIMIAELQNKNIGYSFEKEKHTITSRTPINKLKQYYISDKLLNNLGDISKVQRLPYADLVHILRLVKVSVSRANWVVQQKLVRFVGISGILILVIQTIITSVLSVAMHLLKVRHLVYFLMFKDYCLLRMSIMNFLNISFLKMLRIL